MPRGPAGEVTADEHEVRLRGQGQVDGLARGAQIEAWARKPAWKSESCTTIRPSRVRSQPGSQQTPVDAATPLCLVPEQIGRGRGRRAPRAAAAAQSPRRASLLSSDRRARCLPGRRGLALAVAAGVHLLAQPARSRVSIDLAPQRLGLVLSGLLARADGVHQTRILGADLALAEDLLASLTSPALRRQQQPRRRRRRWRPRKQSPSSATPTSLPASP